LNHPLRKKGIYFDLEWRIKQSLEAYPEIDLKEGIKNENGQYDQNKIQTNRYYNCVILDKNFDVDRVASFELIEKFLFSSIRKVKPKLIVIDSISDLRRSAMEKYEADSGKTAFGFQAWGEINNMVKKILYPIFNYAKVSNSRVIVTCHFTRLYNDGKPTGKKAVDVKDYIIDRVDQVLMLERRKTSYYIQRGKAPRGATEKIEITAEELIQFEF